MLRREIPCSVIFVISSPTRSSDQPVASANRFRSCTMTEIHRRLRDGGPALLFEHAIRADGARSGMPVLVNLFGTAERRWSGREPDALSELGRTSPSFASPGRRRISWML